ncbi:hypothetical protein HDU96_010500 [Phlyctochytrium bullatum]|nr:hypothetical protein HDU96_010500 [Phlyctochytrium bullatum]
MPLPLSTSPPASSSSPVVSPSDLPAKGHRLDSGHWSPSTLHLDPTQAARPSAETQDEPLLLVVPDPPSTEDPAASVDRLLALLRHACPELGPEFPHHLLGSLLIARHELIRRADDTGLPGYQVTGYLVVRSRAWTEHHAATGTLDWGAFHRLCVSESSPTARVIAGMAFLIPGRTLSLWFRDGPRGGDQGFLNSALTRIVEAASVDATGPLHEADSVVLVPGLDYSRSVFFSGELFGYLDAIGRTACVVQYSEPEVVKYWMVPGTTLLEREGGCKGVGEEWAVGELGERFVMDVVDVVEAKKIFDIVEEPYDWNYIHKISTHPTFSRLSRVVQPLPAHTNPTVPASWALTHTNLALGVTATHPHFRRRGLAKHVLASLSLEQAAWIREQDFVDPLGVLEGRVLEGWAAPFLYTRATNAPMQRLATEMGFRGVRAEETAFSWFAVLPPSTTSKGRVGPGAQE